MVLKEYELLQIDETYIRRLQDEDPAALASLSLKLVDDLKEAWDRMNQNSTNSSRPSGSEAPWASSKDDESAAEDVMADESLPDNEADDDKTASSNHDGATVESE